MRFSSQLLVAAAALLLVSGCADDTANAPAETEPTETAAAGPGGDASRSEPDEVAARLAGPVGVQATTAPEWTANDSVEIAATDAGEIAFAQVLVASAAFELRSVEFETQGLIGVDGAVDTDATVDVLLLPRGRLPERFGIESLHAAGSAVAQTRVAAFTGPGPGSFPLLTLEQPVEVPAGRLLILVRLHSVESASGLTVVGRRGSVGGDGDCADHNPEGMFLRVDPNGDTEDGPTVATIDNSAMNNSDCFPPAAFNATLRLAGQRLTPAAGAELALTVGELPVPSSPSEGELTAGPDPDADDADPAGSGTVRIGASCASPGGAATSTTGLEVRCSTIWGQRAWRPVPDAVARDAYAKAAAWIDTLPPNGQFVPIERHPDVPVELEQVLRRALDAAGPLHGNTDQRWILLLGPRYGQPMEDVIARVFANSPASAYPELERWAADVRRPQSCDVYSQVGRNPANGLGFVVALVHTTPVPYCLEESHERIATQLVREYTADAMRGNGWPCWAGEAAGWPTSRALMDRLGLISWEDDWAFWTAQILSQPGPEQLGLRRSVDWTYNPSNGQHCTANPGVGHIQGTLAHELLIHRHGMDGWAGWKRTGSFDAAYGQTMLAFMADADARLSDELGASIAP